MMCYKGTQKNRNEHNVAEAMFGTEFAIGIAPIKLNMAVAC